jgi:hypothetical protein
MWTKPLTSSEKGLEYCYSKYLLIVPVRYELPRGDRLSANDDKDPNQWDEENFSEGFDNYMVIQFLVHGRNDRGKKDKKPQGCDIAERDVGLLRSGVLRHGSQWKSIESQD